MADFDANRVPCPTNDSIGGIRWIQPGPGSQGQMLGNDSTSSTTATALRPRQSCVPGIAGRPIRVYLRSPQPFGSDPAKTRHRPLPGDKNRDKWHQCFSRKIKPKQAYGAGWKSNVPFQRLMGRGQRRQREPRNDHLFITEAHAIHSCPKHHNINKMPAAGWCYYQSSDRDTTTGTDSNGHANQRWGRLVPSSRGFHISEPPGLLSIPDGARPTEQQASHRHDNPPGPASCADVASP